MKLSKLSAALLIAITSNTATANQNTTILNEIFVTDNAIISDNLQTPYSTETYTHKEISKSGTNSLSDFLNQNTSISIQPNYGNPLSPLMDMNGYGTASGYENIQIIVDGVSLNNIDLVPQQLSAVSLSSIEEISILRGAGSVLYGNGATAGAIIISTNKGFKDKDRSNISTSYGSHATTQQTLNIKKTFDIDGVTLLGALNTEAQHSNGSKKINSDGTRNSLDNTNISGTFGIKKNDTSAMFTVQKNDSAVNYPGGMTLDEFNANPGADQASGTMQTYKVENKSLLLSTLLSKNTHLDYTFHNLEKNSTYTSSGYSSDYVQTEHKIDLKTILDSMIIQYGLAKKESNVDTTYASKSRSESSSYVLVNYNANDKLLISSGVRKQFFDYASDSQANSDLNAYNLGINYSLDNQSSIYTNINHAFLVPNFDRLFPSGVFNSDIKPQESDTYTLGYKLKNAKFSAKAEVFYINLNNEIYYYKAPLYQDSKNTNLDKSHKTGINLSLNGSINALKTGVNYNYVHSVIDKETGHNYSGNLLPGVAEHTVNLFAQYDFSSSLFASLPNHSLKLNHKQTSSSFMMDDFNNEGTKAPGYKSTDISYLLSNKQLSLQLGINNIFNESNGLYLYRTTGTKVYATNYDRYYYVTASYQF